MDLEEFESIWNEETNYDFESFTAEQLFIIERMLIRIHNRIYEGLGGEMV